MMLTRNLKTGMSGNDVKQLKDYLFELGFLVNAKGIPIKPTHGVFRADTERAVRSYQASHFDVNGKQLDVDGVVGKATWGALERDYNRKFQPVPTVSVPSTGVLKQAEFPHIALKNLEAINKDLAKVSPQRQRIVREILQYAYDHDKGGSIRGLYVWGANMYTPELVKNVMTAEKINKAASKSPQYFTGGRKEMMLAAIKANPALVGSDCSGMEVGYLRLFKYVSSTFDTTANNFCSDKFSSPVNISALQPADWVGFKGHIGTYVGGGLVVEFAGGAYGCQLTKLQNRKMYSFTTKRLVTGTKWSRFRKPKYY